MPLFVACSSCSAARAASGRAASSSSSSSTGARSAVAVPSHRRSSSSSSSITPSATRSPSSQLACRRRLSAAPSLSSPLASLPAPLCLPIRSLGEDRDVDVDVELELEEEEKIDSWTETAGNSAAASSASAAGAAMLGFFLSALAASADEAATALPAKIPYDPSAGSEFLRNVAGAAYVVLLVIFAFRLLRRRADFATSTRIARGGGGGTSLDDKSLTPEQRRQNFIADQASEASRARRQKPVRATPLRAAVGALQAGFCAFLLWQVCTRVDAFFETFELPEGYTAHNIAVTLRTVGRGLSYLLTFIFAANAAGLGGLAVQLVFYPEPELVEEEEEEDEDKAADALSAAAAAASSSSAMTATPPSSFSSSGNADEDDAAALRPLSSPSAAMTSEDETK